MGEARIGQNPARLTVIILVDQDAARQDPQRPFDDAHILVQHQVMDIGAIEQRAHGGNQHDIVGSNQFPQFSFSFAGPVRGPCEPCQLLPALAALVRTFYCYTQG